MWSTNTATLLTHAACERNVPLDFLIFRCQENNNINPIACIPVAWGHDAAIGGGPGGSAWQKALKLVINPTGLPLAILSTPRSDGYHNIPRLHLDGN